MQKLIFYGIASVILISCGGSEDNQDGQKSAPAAAQPKTEKPAQGEVNITFTADGQTVNTAGWLVQRFLWNENTAVPWLNIVSNMHMDKRTINVNLNGSVPGTYNLQESGMLTNSHGMYTPDYNKIMDSYSFTSGSFIITEVDTIRGVISGTFSGTAKNSEDKIIEITDGQLKNVKLKSGVTNLTAELDKIKQ